MRLMKSRLKLLSMLLLAFASSSAAVKLRGARTRRANEAEKMYFTEGLSHRKGGGKNEDESWGSGDGSSYDPEAAASYDNGSQKQKETIYDRPAMKFSKEGEREQSPSTKETGYKEASTKQGSKVAVNSRYKGGSSTKNGGSTKGATTTKSATTKDKETPPPPMPSKDEMSPPPKESSKGESSQDNTAYDEGKTGESGEKEDPKPAPKGSDERDGNTPGKPPTSPAASPDTSPATSPGGGNENNYSQTQMSQVAYVLSRFGLEYTLGNQVASSVPMTTDFAEVEAATIAYIAEYLELTYDADSTIVFDSVEIEATSRRTGGTGGTPFIDYEASVAFAEDSPMIPTPLEVSQTISEAFQEPNLSPFALNLASRLSTGNPFISTAKMTLYVPDASDGRVAKPKSSMSAAGIAAAAGTGVLSLLVGGFLVYKIRNENMEIKGATKGGYAGGLTLAGDTLDNSTLHNNEDTQSLDESLYNEDRGFLANLPNGAVLGRPVNDSNKPRIRSFKDAPDCKEVVGMDTSRLSDDIPSAYSSDEEEDHERYEKQDGDDEDNFDDEEEEYPVDKERKESGLSSMVGRTRALVPTFKSSHMPNSDIKNYFKTKYNCGSPKGYEAVGDINEGGVQPCPSDDQSLNLVLPALDHGAGVDKKEVKASKSATKPKHPDYESAYMRAFDDDHSADSNSPSDENNQVDETNNEKEGNDTSLVPGLPGEHGHEEDGDSGSVGPRQMDDVSLGPN